MKLLAKLHSAGAAQGGIEQLQGQAVDGNQVPQPIAHINISGLRGCGIKMLDPDKLHVIEVREAVEGVDYVKPVGPS